MDVIRCRIVSVSIVASTVRLGPDKHPQTDKHLKQENQTDKNKLCSHEKCVLVSARSAPPVLFSRTLGGISISGSLQVRSSSL